MGPKTGLKTDYNDSIIVVTSRLVDPDNIDNVDIGNCNEFEVKDDEAKADINKDPFDSVPKVNNVIHSFGLEEYAGSKKDIMATFKEKITAVKELLKDKPDRLKEWGKDGAVSKFVKETFEKFDDCRFFMGKSYANDEPVEGMFIVCYWVNDDDTGETFFYFKDCLKDVKV